MTTKTHTGPDYNEPPILNICSPKKEGPMNQTNVVPGSGGKIVLKWMTVAFSCGEKSFKS